MRSPVFLLPAFPPSTAIVLAALDVTLVACNPDPPVPAADIPAAPTSTPAPAFTVRTINPIPSIAPTSPSRGSWPLDPGDAVPPVSLQIIDPSNAVRLRPLLRLGLGTPSALAFDSSGERLAVGTRTGLISVYAAPAGTLQQRWQAADREIMVLAFTGDDRHLLTADAAGRISIWNPATASSVAAFDTGIRDPHQSALATDALVAGILTFNPLTNRSEISIWDLATGTLLHLRSSPFPVTALALAPNGDSFTIGETDGAVEIFPVSGDGATYPPAPAASNSRATTSPPNSPAGIHRPEPPPSPPPGTAASFSPAISPAASPSPT